MPSDMSSVLHVGCTRSVDDRLAALAYREFRQFVWDELRVGGGSTLPPAYLPSAVSCLTLFAALTLHALFHLMGHWSAAFKARAWGVPATELDEQCDIVVQPPANRGAAVLVPIKRSVLTGQLQAEVQRQTYYYEPPSVCLNY